MEQAVISITPWECLQNTVYKKKLVTTVLQSKYLACSTHYLGMTFINIIIIRKGIIGIKMSFSV